MIDKLTLIPAAGLATRLGGLPKFLLPIPGRNVEFAPNKGVELQTLLAKHIGYARKFSELCIILTRPENAHLISPYLEPNSVEMLALTTNTMTETVLRATRIIPAKETLILMPDTFFSKDFDPLVMALSADELASVAVWPIRKEQIGTVGQVKLSELALPHPRVIEHQDKSEESNLPWLWGAMNLSPRALQNLKEGMPHIGYLLDIVLSKKLETETYCVGARIQNGDYFDCGTPQGYFSLVSRCLSEIAEGRKLNPSL